ncbi:RND transporter [Rossellomorea sp. SC111]|uniref:RND transporter n=1 Tax=Rossellomorea sp. SC111 TaxID=2968985 RepID=UPI00215B70C2|nr:RND transporter [Rossellomorea sp. SC111]MCR8848436.1 RND transporter [Rossellomorea sp. SC111]
MKNKKRFQKINWTVFGLLAVSGVLLALSTWLSLKDVDAVIGEESNRDFRWDSASSTLLMVLLFLTALLSIGWKRVFPFNGPLAIILLGFYFELFFLIFTRGWVGFMGIFGLAITVMIALIMMISYVIYLRFYNQP